MKKNYRKIPLDKLESTRLSIRAHLKFLEETTGKKYAIRTFYLGPRKEQSSKYHTIRQGTTNKADAYAAKIAVYRITRTATRDGRAWNYTELDHYI